MTDRKFTVLIVDDTSTNVLILKKILLNSGYDVLSAENGPDGRALAEEHCPDLILLDIMMSGEDGFETIAKLKSSARTSQIPVIFLTAVSDVDAKIKGFELGAVDFITKPFHPAEIKARTSLHIKLSIATNALIQSQAERLRQVGSAQQSMLLQPQDFPEANFAVYYSSLDEAGGDFYDIIKITGTNSAYFVSDVSGHDIAVSFVTAAIKALLKQNCSPIYTPVESMQIINKVLIDLLPEGKYLTADYLSIDRKNLAATLICMGHPPALLLPADGGEVQLVDSESDVLGSYPDALFQEKEFKVAKGDRLYLYSDGLVESLTGDKVWTSGIKKLVPMIADLRALSLQDSIKALIERCHADGEALADDIVLLATEV